MRALAAGGFRTTIRNRLVGGRLSGLAAIAERFRAGQQLGRYGYPDRPMREPVLQSFADSSGKPAGVITRNSYGCAVLNAAQMFVADVDTCRTPAVSGSRAEAVRRRKARDPWKLREPSICGRASEGERGCKRRAGGLCLIYRTAGGLRVIVADRLIDPSSEEAGIAP